MQSLRDLKRRIRSVRNIGQITKAMEVVSMTKMRRAQLFALEARPYALAAFEMFENLRSMTAEPPALLRKTAEKKRLLVVATSDKGLAGAFNENVIRKANAWIEERKARGEEMHIITIGKKAKDSFLRRGIEPVESYSGFGDFSTIRETSPVAERVTSGFLGGEWDSAEITYTHFRTTLKQEAVVRKILPVTEKGLSDIITSIVPEYGRFHEVAEREEPARYTYEFVFEPSPKEILDSLLPELLKVHLHHTILESNASEHSARMIAMKSAHDNADELGGELNLTYNKARQAGITQELSEVVAGQAGAD